MEEDQLKFKKTLEKIIKVSVHQEFSGCSQNPEEYNKNNKHAIYGGLLLLTAK